MRTVRSELQRAAALASTLILAALFLMAATFKLIDLSATAALIAGAGLPFAAPLAIAAAFFEATVAFSLISGRLIEPFSLVAAIYVLILGILFHGPATWANPLQFAIFTYHFVFIAALLLTAIHPRPPHVASRRTAV